MVFSSPIFLFVFLPATLLLYYLLPRAAKNGFLLAASLVFYAWGEIFYVLIMLFSIVVNYLIGLSLEKAAERPGRKRVLIAGVVANLALLAYFKYANFIVDNINQVLIANGSSSIDWSPVHLPLGISFFTFQAMSYLIDVYRGENQAQRNPVNVALYIALFPQLIAGPIVRYHDIAKQIRERVITLLLVNSGIQRFIYGLAKKVLIANPLGLVADQIFAISGGDLTTGLAWLGLVCYTLQIYFDFSGYSDMAIGLGRMLGFRFLENFNYPYISTSIREFWRRWHISLSSWFRDYLYIPLGGNRKGPARTYVNLLIVFCLCGLWHGASWTFLIWGVFNGGFLALERTRIGSLLDKLPRVLGHAYTLLVVMAGWVFFRTETLADASAYFRALAGLSEATGQLHYVAQYLDARTAFVLLVGIVLATPVMSALNRKLLVMAGSGQGAAPGLRATAYSTANVLVLSSLLLLCMTAIAANAYSPFIYFRF
jgi:alginate O-acetyltransferase complex protein AlgI